MTNDQILVITLPMAFNGALWGLVFLWLRVRFDAIDKRFDALERKTQAWIDAIRSRDHRERSFC